MTGFNTKNNLLFYTVMFFLINAMIVGSANAVTLTEELNGIIDKHPSIMANQEKLLSADAEVDAAEDNYMPVLNISGDLGEQNYKNTGTDVDSSLNNNRMEFSVTQNLFRGYKDQAKENEMRSKYLSSQLSLDKTIQKLIYKGSTTYIDVMRYTDLSDMIKKKVQLSNNFINMRSQERKSGAGSQVNIYEAKLSLQRSLDQQLNIDGKKQNAFNQYHNIFDHAADSADMIKPEVIDRLLPETLEQAINIAKESNLNISIARGRMDQANFLKDSADADYWPLLDLVGSYNKEKNYEGIEGTKTDSRIYLKLYWKYNLGNQVGAKSRSADKKFIAEKYSYEAVIKDIEQKVNQAWVSHQTQKNRRQLTLETVEIAQMVYQSRQQLKQKGGGNDMNLLNSKVRLLDAEMANLNAEYDELKSSYELAYVSGLLSMTLFDN